MGRSYIFNRDVKHVDKHVCLHLYSAILEQSTFQSLSSSMSFPRCHSFAQPLLKKTLRDNLGDNVYVYVLYALTQYYSFD